MDINNIFNTFSDPEDETSMLIDFSDHPLFWIGGFNKIISNHMFFKEYTVRTFKNVSPDLNLEDLEKAGESIMFAKAWNFIKNIDVNKNFHKENLKLKASNEFMKNLDITIDHFEKFEEYEKCALLQNIKEMILGFLT